MYVTDNTTEGKEKEEKEKLKELKKARHRPSILFKTEYFCCIYLELVNKLGYLLVMNKKLKNMQKQLELKIFNKKLMGK